MPITSRVPLNTRNARIQKEGRPRFIVVRIGLFLPSSHSKPVADRTRSISGIHVGVWSESPEEAIPCFPPSFWSCGTWRLSKLFLRISLWRKNLASLFVFHCNHIVHVQHRRIPLQLWLQTVVHLGSCSGPQTQPRPAPQSTPPVNPVTKSTTS